MISYVRTQVNIDDSALGVPNWVEIDPADLKYEDNRNLWPTCEVNANCTDGHVCAKHRWEYNGQFESGQGCWPFAVCSGHSSYNMFDGRKIQWFCDSYSDLAADGLDPPFPNLE